MAAGDNTPRFAERRLQWRDLSPGARDVTKLFDAWYGLLREIDAIPETEPERVEAAEAAMDAVMDEIEARADAAMERSEPSIDDLRVIAIVDEFFAQGNVRPDDFAGMAAATFRRVILSPNGAATAFA